MSRLARFLTDLITREVCEIDNIHELEIELVYDCAFLDCRITVPKGFRTDFASVPRLPFAYFVVGGKGNKAAVVHDFLYSGGLVLRNGMPVTLGREQCDAVLAEALKACGYSALTVWLMHTGVRLGGESHFQGPNLPQHAGVSAGMAGPRPLVVESP